MAKTESNAVMDCKNREQTAMLLWTARTESNVVMGKEKTMFSMGQQQAEKS